MLFAAMIHDVEHPGVNNPFHVRGREGPVVHWKV